MTPEQRALQVVRIVRAAIRLNGKVHTTPKPGRHHHIIRMLAERGFPTPITGEQGFLTNKHRFVRRVKARRIARDAGQLLPDARMSRQLFSEDVW